MISCQHCIHWDRKDGVEVCLLGRDEFPRVCVRYIRDPGSDDEVEKCN